MQHPPLDFEERGASLDLRLCFHLQPVADLPRLREQFAAPDEKLVLMVGRLVYEKGFHLALDAMPRLIEQLGRVRFLVAGSGTAEAELKEIAGRAQALDSEAEQVHVMFNNNARELAPKAARGLRTILGQDPGPEP